MGDYRVISADNHIIEPPDLWTGRMDSRYLDSCPRVAVLNGKEVWLVEDRIVGQGVIGQGARAGFRFDEEQKKKLVNSVNTYEQVRPGAYDPDEAVKDMDIDGIDVGVIYPTEAFEVYHECRGSELLTAIFATYNDWLGEFCGAQPERLKGIGMINIDDVQTGIREMERCRKMGMMGAGIPVFNSRMRYNSPYFEPLWSAAEDLDMTISLHINTNRPADHEEFGVAGVAVAPLFFITGDYWPKLSLADMILSGVFERHPKMRVTVVEYELGWAANFVQRLDYHYDQSASGLNGYRFKGDMMPSDYFHKHCFIGTMEDGLGIKLRDIIGVDNIMWGADYPHVESTFPKSQEFLAQILADCTEEEKAKISGGNATRAYGL